MLKHHDWKDVDPMWEMAEKLKDDRAVNAVTSLGARPKGPFSFSCGYIDSIVTVKEFIENMVRGAEEIMEGLAREWQLGRPGD
jgi:hypothetical protein